MLNIDQIQKILPQRYPFLMIDKVEELETNKRVVAVKNVTINDGFFEGHFPEKPIMPGVLIIEAMAQASIILFYESKEFTPDNKLSYYLASVKMRFLYPVIPGDQLKITVTPIKVISTGAIVDASATVEDREVAKGELTFSAKKE